MYRPVARFYPQQIAWLALALLSLGGCTAPVGEPPTITPARDAHTMAPTTPQPAPTTPTPARQIASATALPSLTPIPTTTPAPTSDGAPTSDRFGCAGPPALWNLNDTAHPFSLASLAYATNTTLGFAGWSSWENAPASSVVAMENRPDRPADPLTYFSTTVLGSLDLATGNRQYQSDQWKELLTNPCPGPCTYDILAQTPDSQWQLAAIWHEEATVNGIWLLGHATTHHLISFVPPAFGWQWGPDSSTLLVEYSPAEFGAVALLIDLDSELPPLALSATQPALDPTSNILLLGPEQGELLALAGSRNREISQAEPVLRHYQLVDGVLSLLNESPAPQLRDIRWDPLHKEIVFGYADGTKAWFTLGANGPALELPFTAFTEFIAPDIVRRNVPFRLVAIQPELAELAVSLGDNRIYIFGCGPAE